MTQDGGTGERIYARLKAAVLEGALTPHLKLDFVELAERFGVSTTPVREAAMRLLGEGLLEVHAKGGSRPLLASEVRLRSLLDFHEKIALAAIDWRVEPLGTIANLAGSSHEERTRDFFCELAKGVANPELVAAVGRLSDQLAPFRHREERLIADAAAELRNLETLFTDRVHLKRGVRAYHRRRFGLVPQRVWMTNSGTS